MHISYRSDYSNQVHQLNFSISQNHYLLKNGDIKYQAKKFDVDWKNYQTTKKRHLVNFLIRDHYSGCFYAELHPIDILPSMKDFLYNAWRVKENFEFSGFPRTLMLGKHIIESCPEITKLIDSVGLNIELAKNGFATGIRSVREWEHNIKFYSLYEDCRNINGFKNNIELICRDLNSREIDKRESNLIKWIHGLSEENGRSINNREDFYDFLT